MPVIHAGMTVYRAQVKPGLISFEEKVVLSTTPQGFWIYNACSNRDDYTSWYSFRTRQWSATRDEAVNNLYYRKRAHVRHATRRQEYAQRCLETVEEATRTSWQNFVAPRLHTTNYFRRIVATAGTDRIQIVIDGLLPAEDVSEDVSDDIG